jgi:hypothetical protein
MSTSTINELFDPFQMGMIRDKSIDSLQLYPYYPVGGKDISQHQNNTIRIVSKGVDQHLLLSEGYLEGVIQLQMAPGNLVYAIVLNTNDRFTTNLGIHVVPPGNYTLAGLLAVLNAFNANVQFSTVTIGGTEYFVITVIGVGTVQLNQAGFANMLGFTDAAAAIRVGLVGVGGYIAITNVYAANTNTVGVPIMHSNILSIFRKASLYFNNVMVHQVDWPHMADMIQNLRDDCQDYIDKRKDEWLYTDVTSNYVTADPTTAAKRSRTSGNKWVRFQVPMKRLFPFLESYEKVIRGVEVRVELEKNAGNMSEIIMMDENSINTNLVKLNYKELAMWLPILVGSPGVEADIIQSITSKDETLVQYSDYGVYRRLNPSGAEMTWLVDNISEVPKTVYVLCQLATQLDNISIAGNADINPATFNNMLINRAELRVNGHVYPKTPYDRIKFAAATATTADDYTRLFYEWLRVNYKESEYDNGSLITYDTFRSVYTIITFNVSREEEIMMRDGENNVIEIYLNFDEEPAQSFYSWAVVEFESKMLLKSNGKQIEFTKM